MWLGVQRHAPAFLPPGNNGIVLCTAVGTATGVSIVVTFM
jgi:hypothetical protein